MDRYAEYGQLTDTAILKERARRLALEGRSYGSLALPGLIAGVDAVHGLHMTLLGAPSLAPHSTTGSEPPQGAVQ